MKARVKAALRRIGRSTHRLVLRALRIGRWPFTPDRLISIASVVTILGLPIAIYQIRDLREQREARTFAVMSYADQQLNSGVNVKIRHAIFNRLRLLQQNGGEFTPENLRDYLNVFDTLGEMHERGRIDFDSLYFWHGDSISRAFRNAEVQWFIKLDKMGGNFDYYVGFESIRPQSENNSGSAPIRK